MSDDLLLVGRVARAHGNRGQVIVNPDTDFADERFTVGHVLLVGPPDRAEPREIREVRFQQGRPIIGFHGVDSMNDAEALAGSELWMPAGAIAPLPEGTYYRHDLIGCEVIDTNGAALGTVRVVEGTLDRSYLVVTGEAGDVMIPMVEEFCMNVDLATRRITVSIPEGLIELNASSGERRTDGSPSASSPSPPAEPGSE